MNRQCFRLTFRAMETELICEERLDHSAARHAAVNRAEPIVGKMGQMLHVAIVIDFDPLVNPAACVSYFYVPLYCSKMINSYQVNYDISV